MVLRGGRSITKMFIGLDDESCFPKLPKMFMELDSYRVSKSDSLVLRGNVES